jgi:hypothetical protein
VSQLRLGVGVKWQAWPDGCVVFSAPLAQTFLLSPDCEQLFTAITGECSVGELESSCPQTAGLLPRLIDLGLIELAA